MTQSRTLSLITVLNLILQRISVVLKGLKKSLGFANLVQGMGIGLCRFKSQLEHGGSIADNMGLNEDHINAVTAMGIRRFQAKQYEEGGRFVCLVRRRLMY